MSRHSIPSIDSSLATMYGGTTGFPDMIPIPKHCPIGLANTMPPIVPATPALGYGTAVVQPQAIPAGLRCPP